MGLVYCVRSTTKTFENIYTIQNHLQSFCQASFYEPLNNS